jgi:hypothetical protein
VGLLLTKNPSRRPSISEVLDIPLVKYAVFDLILEFKTEQESGTTYRDLLESLYESASHL